MVTLIESNCRITLKIMAEALKSKFGITFSKQTIRRHLDGLSYTLKNVRFEPERANSKENKVKRKIFVEKLLIL